MIWLDLGLNPGLPDHWWTFYSLGQWTGLYIYIYIYIYIHIYIYTYIYIYIYISGNLSYAPPTIDHKTTNPMLSQTDKVNVQLRKKTMTERKTTLLSFRKHVWKKIKAEKKWFTNIPTDNIHELNELIYAGSKLVWDFKKYLNFSWEPKQK